MKQAIIGIIIIILAGLAAFGLVSSREEPEEKLEKNIVPLVQAAPLDIRSGNLQVRGSGTVRSLEELTLSSEIPGKLIYVNPALKAGQRITKGAVLFRIDPADYQSAAQAAEADVALQGVNVLQAREEVKLAEAELERFNTRKANENAARTSVDSNDYAAQILPPDELQSGGGTIERVAKPIIDKPQKTNGLATQRPQLQSAQAALRRARAMLADARTSLGRTVVRAPFSGIVRTENIALGSYVQPGQALATIAGTGSFEAVIPLSSEEAALIPNLFSNNRGRIEASIISTYGDNKYSWNGYVDRVNSVLNPQTRTIDLFLRIPNPTRAGSPVVVNGVVPAVSGNAPPLFIGNFVEAEISGKALDEYAVLPLGALRGDNKIWIVRDGQLKIINVEILQRTDTSALISTEGLGAKPLLITSPLKTATDGQKVRVAKQRTTQKAAPNKSKKPAGSSKSKDTAS